MQGVHIAREAGVAKDSAHAHRQLRNTKPGRQPHVERLGLARREPVARHRLLDADILPAKRTLAAPLLDYSRRVTYFPPAVVSCQTCSFGICDAGVPAGGIIDSRFSRPVD